MNNRYAMAIAVLLTCSSVLACGGSGGDESNSGLNEPRRSTSPLGGIPEGVRTNSQDEQQTVASSSVSSTPLDAIVSDASEVNEELCGDQECGGPCGVCSEELVCISGKCVTPPCEPDCVGKSCGPDLCGEVCGQCPGDLICSPLGKCVTPECEPQCVDKSCGSDGCGDLCGTCEPPLYCEDFQCLDPADCVPSCKGLQCGNDGCGGSCGLCPDSWYCVDGTCELLCELDCLGKECGFDGCDGVCGTCQPGEVCTQDFQCELEGCEPSCGENECGPNGCGGLCGICLGNTVCLDGFCMDPIDGCSPITIAGCEGCACEECVCETLSYCCDVQWTEDCATFCGVCGACTN